MEVRTRIGDIVNTESDSKEWFNSGTFGIGIVLTCTRGRYIISILYTTYLYFFSYPFILYVYSFIRKDTPGLLP